MERNLFNPVTRDERQEEIRVKWIKAGGCGTLVASTGFGKTRVGTNCIKCFVNKYPSLRVLIVVPTVALKDQWEGILNNLGLSLNCEVVVINTAIKNSYNVDFLVIDEAHRVSADTFRRVFDVVKYRFILGLTATFERLDGKHAIISKYCPVFDEVSVEESRRNGWIADYKEYKVILNVDNIEEYKQLNAEFTKSFEFFNFDWNLVMSLVGPKGFINRAKLRDERCPNGSESDKKRLFSNITYHAMNCMHLVQSRKTFINNHPKKIEIARKIIEARSDQKIIVFSNNVKMAEALGVGSKVYTGKDSKKKGRMTMEEFCNAKSAILSVVKRADEGINVPGLSVAIMMGIDSSKTRKTQRIGRAVRKEGDKEAEIFTLVLNDTQETKWAENSNVSSNVITIDEEGLNDVLAGKEPKPYKRKIKDFTFRF